MVRAPGGHWSDLLAQPKEGLAQFTLYSGHYYRALHRFLGEDLDVIIFLRNPIDRSISHFEHICRAPGHYFYERTVRHNSFLEFILDPVTRPMVENFQVRAIVNQFDPVSVRNAVAGTDCGRHAIEQRIESMALQYSSETALLIAKDYLTRARLVGLTERTQQAVELGAVEFGWPEVRSLEKLNVATNKSTSALRLSDAELEAVTEATRLDWALYEYACGVFERRLSAARALRAVTRAD